MLKGWAVCVHMTRVYARVIYITFRLLTGHGLSVLKTTVKRSALNHKEFQELLNCIITGIKL